MSNPMYSEIDEYPRNWPDGVPRSLDRVAPGPILAAYLSSIDVRRISGHDRVTVLRARQRMASHYAAQLLDDMDAVASIFTDGVDDPSRLTRQLMNAATEIRVALNLTRRAADIELTFALDLAERHPKVRNALSTGRIDARRARIIANDTVHLDDEVAAQVVERIIDDAPNLTTGQLAAKIRRACIEVAPEEAEERYAIALDDRRVTTRPSDDGTAHIYAMDLPPDAVASATRRINDIAKSLRTEGETRSMDQLRADIFLDLLNGHVTASGDRRGTVDIRVDLTTLIELDEKPGDLAGYGPVIADIARKVASTNLDSEWRYSVTDPTTGRIVTNGTTRRRPTTTERRYLESVHPTCVFPGCRMPATECDMDHRMERAAGGPTVVENLTPLCRTDHVVRHNAGWTYVALPNGDIEWTSPLGHTYTTKPSDNGRSPP